MKCELNLNKAITKNIYGKVGIETLLWTPQQVWGFSGDSSGVQGTGPHVIKSWNVAVTLHTDAVPQYWSSIRHL